MKKAKSKTRNKVVLNDKVIAHSLSDQGLTKVAGGGAPWHPPDYTSKTAEIISKGPSDPSARPNPASRALRAKR